MHPVDAVLQSARQLLGTMSPAHLSAADYGPEHTAQPANWSGDAADTAKATSAQLDNHRGQLRTAHQAVGAAVTEANQISRAAHTGLRAVETAWASDKAALGPYANTPEGQAALLTAGQQRVQEATQVVDTAAGRFQAVAQQVQAAGLDLPLSPPPPQQTRSGRGRR